MAGHNIHVSDSTHNLVVDDSTPEITLNKKESRHVLVLTTPLGAGDPQDYNMLRNKPVINGVEVRGSLSLADLGIIYSMTPLTTRELDNIVGE